LCSRSACLAEFTAQSPAWHSRIRAFPMVQSIQIWAHPPRPSHTHTIWSGFAPMILSVTAGALLHSQVHTPPPHSPHMHAITKGRLFHLPWLCKLSLHPAVGSIPCSRSGKQDLLGFQTAMFARWPLGPISVRKVIGPKLSEPMSNWRGCYRIETFGTDVELKRVESDIMSVWNFCRHRNLWILISTKCPVSAYVSIYMQHEHVPATWTWTWTWYGWTRTWTCLKDIIFFIGYPII
jgi:hypothetical protein